MGLGSVLRGIAGRESRTHVDCESALSRRRICPIAGYIVARETAGELHINNVAVRPEYRRRGIGAALLGRVLQEACRRKAKAALLEVRSANLAAQKLYEKHGFKAIARRSDYYSEPREDAVVMSLVFG